MGGKVHSISPASAERDRWVRRRAPRASRDHQAGRDGQGDWKKRTLITLSLLLDGASIRYIPNEAKKTAATPSRTITKKIALTTDTVVCRPSDSALPLTWRPSTLATMPITSAINGALLIPTMK